MTSKVIEITTVMAESWIDEYRKTHPDPTIYIDPKFNVTEDFERFVQEQERERCAKIAEEYDFTYHETSSDICNEIAKAIREGKNE